MVMALPAASSVWAVQQEMTDQKIADAIEDEFLFDPAIPSNDIDVNVIEGIAKLKGSVDNILAQERAEERSDTAIRKDVEAALLQDPATDSYEVDVSVEEGSVTLTGTVQSWNEKELCGKVAKGVRGVLDIVNNIDIGYRQERSDAEIQAEIERTLRWDILLSHALINVTVEEGRVTLSGTVGSAAEKRRARSNAWVGGVKSVDDSGLEVARWARDEDLREDKFVIKPAQEIEDAIKDALVYDPRVFSFHVTPDVLGSTVTLRGAVDNLQAKRAAEQVARNTVGVRFVTNRLKVRPVGEFSDEEIAENIRNAMLRDPYVDRFQVDVRVVNGVVYLNGTVDSYFEKSQADDVASKVNGVVDVNNNLDVRDDTALAYRPYVDDLYVYDYDWYDYEPHGTFKSDAEIKKAIERELWWSPFVDSGEITVTVEDGKAKLTGTVDSWAERGAATDNAYQGGAVSVDNELEVVP
jgi:osmotically-inducible protein OsmY